MEATKPKKRAFRACMPCRARKVRCVVTGSFQPCMNCRLDEKDCDFARGAKIYPKYPRNRLSRARTPDTQSDASSHECLSTCNYARHPVNPDASNTSHPGQQRPSNDAPILPCQPSSTPSVQASLESAGLLYDPTEPSYSFLQVPKSKTVLPQDLEFLYNQGCFFVPQRHVLDEFMHKYFSFIHTILPILNEADFWAMYNSKTEPDKCYERISIVVLQGMLFTSSTFLSQETIESLGFKTTQDAKYTFYRRAKLLYDFGYERSSIAVAQAAVLLSHSHLIPLPYGGYKQLGALWTGIAIHHARDARAHRYSLISPNSLQTPQQLKQYNTLKRLWWCCIISDRVIPLTSRQNIKITKANFNFDDSPILSLDDLADEFDHSEVYDRSTKTFLAQALIKIVELCVVLTDVLSLSNVVHENPSWGLSQKISDTSPAAICRIQLQRWYNGFLEWKSTMSRKHLQDASEQPSGNSVVLYTNLAEMYYHSARLPLCHYEMLHLGQAASALNASHDITDMLQKSYELQNAIAQVTECLAELTRLGLTRWLPMSAVGCTAFPLALQILDVELLQLKVNDLTKSKGTSVFPGYRQERLNILIDAMKTYRPRYFIVDWVAQIIRHIVNVAQKCLPSTEASSGGKNLSIASWIEILQMQPNCYLRLALTMDLSISHGKLPDETDFPPVLRYMLHGRILESPQSFPFSLDVRPNTSIVARNNGSLTTTQSTKDYDEGTTSAQEGSTPPTQNPDGSLFQEASACTDDVFGGLNPVLGITNYPSMAPTSDLPELGPSWGLSGAQPLTGEPFGLISPFNFQPINFDLGNDSTFNTFTTPLDTFQWSNYQPDSREQNIEASDPGVDALTSASNTRMNRNDHQLLEELGKMLDLT